jgi:hypothetical protein
MTLLRFIYVRLTWFRQESQALVLSVARNYSAVALVTRMIPAAVRSSISVVAY